MIKALFKFDKNIPKDALVIDTTSNSGNFRELSPFVLQTIDRTTGRAVVFENLWQYSKVYNCHIAEHGSPSVNWFKWHYDGWANPRAVRYPMGKGAIPEYSYWQDGFRGEWNKLGYIEARKKIYAPEYAKWVGMTDSFKKLESFYHSGDSLILLDYDAYDHQAMGMSLKDVINNPTKKMGHAFVLMMMLTNVLEECLI